jgi:hypothetical protein
MSQGNDYLYPSLILAEQYGQEFSSEAVLWRQLCHPNVLPFYGVYVDMDRMKFGLTSPWMVNGNIVQFLKAYPNTYCVDLVS